MAVLSTAGITMPQQLADGIWSKAADRSVVAQLAGRSPMKFGNVDYMTFNKGPRAEFVGEGGQKASSDVEFGTKQAKPYKAQVTVRFNEEVKWADEDYQLGVLAEVGDAMSVALSRALDFGVIHGVNPLTGTPMASNPEKIMDSALVVTTSGDIEGEIETATGLVVASRYMPNAVGIDPAYAWQASTARYADGRKKFPDLGLTVSPSNLMGLPASAGDTLSGMPEIEADTGLKAIIGDWSLLKWGVQREIPLQVIETGDPDGQGDLKRHNQIAIRAEVVFGWGIFDPNGFALIKAAA